MEKSIVITGASSGIGRELALLAAYDFDRVVIVARNETALTALASTLTSAIPNLKTTLIPYDLSQPDAGQAVYNTLLSQSISVHTLVNNAGYGSFGYFYEVPIDTTLRMMQLNMTTLTELTYYCLSDMLKRREGQILNVASTAAFQPGPLMAAYYATKAYVLSFSEALSNELEGTGVSVTTVCPGPTASNFQAQANMEESRLVKGKKLMTASEVARQAYAGLKRKKRIVIPGFINKLLTLSTRLAPRKTILSVVRYMQERRT